MSRSFADTAKAEENYQILDQLKDANIWKILTNLVDPNTGFNQACTFRVRVRLKGLHFITGLFQVICLRGNGSACHWRSLIWTPVFGFDSLIYHLTMRIKILK